ncbi:phospholipase D1-like [Biomphalaria glabrata]|uniref:Phospholipase n=1 Tax=Biomphalaria glabrata TaxID=6526 RepID=A0A9U8EIU7_BIOGL|nr:phospholipase D1-like [Biomphalaria glabrata]
MMNTGDSVNIDTTREFLRSFSVIDVEESDSDSDYEELSPIPETPADLDINISTDDADASGAKLIPYKDVFRQPVPFSGQRDNCWIPGVPITVEITLHDRQPASNVLNPNLYLIKVKHGDFEWTILRRYKHFRQLHDSLAFFLAKYRMPLPNKNYHERRATIMKDIRGHKKRQKDRQQQTVRLPKRPEALVSEDKIDTRIKQLKEYLENLVLCKSYRNHPETLKFFEVSHLSFVNKLGIKGKEGLIEKCSGGRRINIQCCGCLQNVHFAGTWNKRWLVVKDNFLLYVRPEDGHISDVLLMDSAFSVKHGLSNTGRNHAILIENLSRKLLIKCWTSRKAKEWAEQIQNVASRQAIDYIQKNRFGSFAPARENTYARWFVDGRSYFEAVADALEKAKEEIYITDWWLSPEIYLKRPIVDGDKWRLDVILKRKAEEGVKIFVLLYKEIEAALSIKSIYSKQTLMSLCPENIKVLRHPDHIPGKGVLLWAHHEKLVIIDQQIAFTGGLDLCYGRWDDEFHKLTDLGSISLMPKPNTPEIRIDNNYAHEFSSNTELSVISSDNASVSEINLRTSSQNNVVPSITSTKDDKAKQCLSGSNPSSPQVLSAESQRSLSSTSSHRQPLDAKIIVKVTNTNDEQVSDSEVASTRSYPSDSSLSNTGQELQPQNIQFRYSKSDSDTESVASSKPPDSLPRAVDIEGFTETELQEINQSMQPFRNFHRQRSPRSELGAEVVLSVSLESGKGFDPLLDKEIICSPDAADIPDHARPRSSPASHQKARHSLSPQSKKDKSSPSSSPKTKLKNEQNGSSVAGAGVSASHLWKRRSKNQNSLQLKMPDKNSADKISQPTDGRQQNRLNSSGEIKSVRNGTRHLSLSSKPRKKDRQKMVSDEVRFQSTSNTVDIITENQASPDTIQKAPGSAPVSSSRNFSFASTATAANALRKLLHRRESNNNDEVDDNSGKTNMARRRWRMILNVSKFESMVRSPQEPERIDESLFYNQNIKHPSTRSKLVKSFKDGVDRLKRHGRRDSDVDMQLQLDKNYLQVPRQLYHTQSEEDILERGLQGSTKLWIGKDYVNFIHKDFVGLDQPFDDFINRKETPRMPWHDIGCVVYGKSARDLARHFIGRWNFTKLEKFKRNPSYPLLLPKTTSKFYIPQSIKGITFEVKAQILRSSTGWSAGLSQPEDSIHKAYEHCIENARDYIYIENQFFISLVEGSGVNNCIGNALYKRILRAHRSNSNFKVYVVLPLLPAFEGEFGTSTGVALQAITHWNYASICRGGNSLMEKLSKEVPDPNKYIVFCGLRTWDKLNNKLVTELVYVHSKLMIVDDDTVIIGSANINDRSLLGNRDSEIAVMFEDVQKTDVMVNGKKYTAGKFASSLRWTIFREHLGIHNEPDFVDLTDISCDSFYKDVWMRIAAVNTTCFDKVFRCLPTDNVTNFAKMRQYQTVLPLAQTDEAEAMKLLNKVKGYLVLLPLQFLRDENLAPRVGQKEALLPISLWT